MLIDEYSAVYGDLIHNLSAGQLKYGKVFYSSAIKLIYEGLQQDIIQNDFALFTYCK